MISSVFPWLLISWQILTILLNCCLLRGSKLSLKWWKNWPVQIACEWKSLVVFDSLWPHGLHSPWNSLGQNTGVGSLSLLWGNLPHLGIKPRTQVLQADCLPAEHKGSPRIQTACRWLQMRIFSKKSRKH